MLLPCEATRAGHQPKQFRQSQPHSKVLHPHRSMVGVHPHEAHNSIGCTDGLHAKLFQPPELLEPGDCEDLSVDAPEIVGKHDGSHPS